jgi:hypothetical protein
MVRKNIFWTGPTKAANSEQKSLVTCTGTTSPMKEGTLSFVLFESPFTSFSSFNSQQGPPLSSLSEEDFVKQPGENILIQMIQMYE